MFIMAKLVQQLYEESAHKGIKKSLSLLGLRSLIFIFLHLVLYLALKKVMDLAAGLHSKVLEN